MSLLTELDATDLRLLELLQNDARMPNKQLAAAIGVAQSTCSARMRRLESIGAIEGYHAAVNVFHMTGDTDFLVQVAVRDSNHLQELTTDTFTVWPEVGRIRTAVAFSYKQRHRLPNVTGR